MKVHTKQHVKEVKPGLGSRYLAVVLCGLLVATVTGCGADDPRLQKLAPTSTVLAFGDSLTAGTGADSNHSYPAVLSRLSGLEVINAGVSGELSEAGLARLPGLLDQHQPQLLILCHAGNDILRKRNLTVAAANLTQMIALARGRNIDVVLIGVPKPGLFLNVADLYTNVAEQTGVLLDTEILPEILAASGLKSDPVHPNAKGYTVFGEQMYALLQANGAL